MISCVVGLKRNTRQEACRVMGWGERWAECPAAGLGRQRTEKQGLRHELITQEWGRLQGGGLAGQINHQFSGVFTVARKKGLCIPHARKRGEIGHTTAVIGWGAGITFAGVSGWMSNHLTASAGFTSSR